MKHILSSLVALVIWSLGHGQDHVSQINANITQSQIKAHLEFLASDALQGRETGTNGIDAAAAYLASRFRAMDVKTYDSMTDYHQRIGFQKTTPPSSSSIEINGAQLNFPDDFILLNGGERMMKSQSVFIDNRKDGKEEDLRLKVMVSICGDGTNQDVGGWIRHSREKRKQAVEAGAVAIIEIYKNAAVPWRFIKGMASRSQTSLVEQGDPDSDIPHIWIGSEDTSVVSALMSQSAEISFDIEGLEKETVSSSNIVGWVEGTDPNLKDEYIVFSAHYDHVGVGRPDATGDAIYNGARDNGVGTTAVMMLAEYLSQFPMRRSALFVFFTAEEKGLLGSQWFVDHSPVPLEQIKYCFNIDNGGYNDTSIVSVIGLTRTEAQEDISKACSEFGLEAIEDPAKEQGLFDRSDNVNFAKKGIPAPTFSLGFRAFDAEIFKYYHQPGDEVESLNFDYLEKYVKSYILSSIQIGNASTAPFWLEGDKYYEAGVELYQSK